MMLHPSFTSAASLYYQRSTHHIGGDLAVIDAALVLGEVGGIGEPRNSFGESAANVILRTPVGEAHYLGVVAPQAEHLRLSRAQTLGIGHPLHIALHNLGNQLQRVGHRDFGVGGNVDFLTLDARCRGKGKEAAAGVLHIVEVARRSEVAHLDFACAIGNLRDDGGNDGTSDCRGP